MAPSYVCDTVEVDLVFLASLALATLYHWGRGNEKGLALSTCATTKYNQITLFHVTSYFNDDSRVLQHGEISAAVVKVFQELGLSCQARAASSCVWDLAAKMSLQFYLLALGRVHVSSAYALLSSVFGVLDLLVGMLSPHQ